MSNVLAAYGEIRNYRRCDRIGRLATLAGDLEFDGNHQCCASDHADHGQCIALSGIIAEWLGVHLMVSVSGTLDSFFQPLVDKGHYMGIVVGVIHQGQRQVYSYGIADPGAATHLTGDSLFEIGSITKTFTGILLAELVRRHLLTLTDPIHHWLPTGIISPSYAGEAITLLDLATHTSSLPRLPSNLQPRDPANPYADYTENQMYSFLADYRLSRAIGSSYEYSNYGVGLLGNLLARASNTSFTTLVEDEICHPLRMDNTRFTLTPAEHERLIPGHASDGQVVSSWDISILAGAGGLRSTVHDMLTFLAANLQQTPTPLAQAMEAAHQPCRRAFANVFIGLCWHMKNVNGLECVGHEGSSGGYASFLQFNRKRQFGIVALANTTKSEQLRITCIEATTAFLTASG